jgi:hypothetical protein
MSDLESVIREAESIKYSTPLFERMKLLFVRLRDAIKAIDSGLMNGKVAKRGKDFIDDSVSYGELEVALSQVWMASNSSSVFAAKSAGKPAAPFRVILAVHRKSHECFMSWHGRRKRWKAAAHC